jgi:hypothetical protein
MSSTASKATLLKKGRYWSRACGINSADFVQHDSVFGCGAIRQRRPKPKHIHLRHLHQSAPPLRHHESHPRIRIIASTWTALEVVHAGAANDDLPSRSKTA